MAAIFFLCDSISLVSDAFSFSYATVSGAAHLAGGGRGARTGLAGLSAAAAAAATVEVWECGQHDIV